MHELKTNLTERYEIELLSSIFGEEDMFNMKYDDDDTEYELEVIVRRINNE